MIVVGFFYYFEKIFFKLGSFIQVGVRMFIDFNFMCEKLLGIYECLLFLFGF